MAEEASASKTELADKLGRPLRTPKTAELVARKLRRMIVDGQLVDGDHLPHEAELMEHFSVSRPTLREAVPSARSRTTCRGPSRFPHRRTNLRARTGNSRPPGIAPTRIIRCHSRGRPSCQRIPRARSGRHSRGRRNRRSIRRTGKRSSTKTYRRHMQPETFGHASARFHLLMVQLSGNATLALVAGMLERDLRTPHSLGVALTCLTDTMRLRPPISSSSGPNDG